MKILAGLRKLWRPCAERVYEIDLGPSSGRLQLPESLLRSAKLGAVLVEEDGVITWATWVDGETYPVLQVGPR